MRSRRLFLCLALSAAAAAPGAAPAAAAGPCDLVVATGGSDTAAGTADAPFATPDKLIDELATGQTGCVRGKVDGDAWIEADRVTLTSEPGQRGTIRGEVVVDEEAEGVTVSDLDLRKRDFEYPSPVILGDDATLTNNDITSDGVGICVLLGAKGHHSGAKADRTLIAGNRIHDCGTSNNHQHGIYVEHADDTRIIGNEIFDNADRGIQLYPDAQNTEIAGNVIDGNGEGVIISGTGGSSSSGTRIHHNVLTNPRLRASVESWFDSDSPVGRDNVVERNCIFGGKKTIDEGGGGFVARDNVIADPGYADRGAKDFRVDADGPCAALLIAGRAGVDLPAAAEAAPVTPAATTVSTSDPKDPDAALSISLLRSGPATGAKRVVTVRIRPLDPVTVRTYARVEVRYFGRGWRVIGMPRVRAGAASALRVRVPRRARGLAVRATLLKPTGHEVVTFRAPARVTRG